MAERGGQPSAPDMLSQLGQLGLGPGASPPGLLQMAQDAAPALDNFSRGIAPMLQQPAGGGGGWAPGLEINDPNVWHRVDAEWNEQRRASDANNLLSHIASTYGGTEGPGLKTSAGIFGGWEDPKVSPYGRMTDAAEKVMKGQKFPVDPSRIVYRGGTTGSGGFRLDSETGPDLFAGSGQLQGSGGFFPMSGIPRELQPLLAPALNRYYHDNDYQGGAMRGQESAPWTAFFAPPAGESHNTGQFGRTWPGINRIDPWGRHLGTYANLYS